MTNIFRILWFEDDTVWYNMASRKVRRHIQDKYCLGLRPERSTGADFDPSVLTSNNEYDLILLDYKLAAGQTGKKIVDLIRSNAVLTDVLLYSSEYDVMIKELQADNPLIDGVFFANRKDVLFDDKLFSIIHKIVRRSEDIVNLRGFFLDNTSDFEVRIKELLNLAWTKLPESRDRMNKAMIDSLDNIEKFTSKNLGKIRKNDPLYECANNHKYALTIRNRVKILSEIIDILVNEKGLVVPTEGKDLEQFDSKYNEEISVYRNALSHKKYSDTSIIIDGKVVVIDDSLHQKLRTNINKYDSMIAFLEDALTKF